MNTEQQRQELLKAYSSDSWKQKVSKMSESQIQAIYIRLKSQGKLR
jgi:hypothetical protein